MAKNPKFFHSKRKIHSQGEDIPGTLLWLATGNEPDESCLDGALAILFQRKSLQILYLFSYTRIPWHLPSQIQFLHLQKVQNHEIWISLSRTVELSNLQKHQHPKIVRNHWKKLLQEKMKKNVDLWIVIRNRLWIVSILWLAVWRDQQQIVVVQRLADCMVNQTSFLAANNAIDVS